MKTFRVIIELAWDGPHSEIVEHEVIRDLNKIWAPGEHTVHIEEHVDQDLLIDREEDDTSEVASSTQLKESGLKSFSVIVEAAWESPHMELAEHEVIRELNKIWTPGEYTVHIEEDLDRLDGLIDEDKDE